MRTTIWLGTLALGASTLVAQQYTISTIAGGGGPPASVPALDVRVPISGGVATGSAGDMYFSSSNSVMKLDGKGILTRVAGTGKYGYSGDGGPATDAKLAWPGGLAMDGSGNLFIADNANHRIRKVTPEGIISTIAGTTAGISGDGGPATSAQLNWPTGVAVDGPGNLYIADSANHRIRKISPNGMISSVMTDLHHAEAVAVDASGNLFVADYVVSVGDEDFGNYYIGRILRMTANGSTDTLAEGQGNNQGLLGPRGIAVDASGNVYAADPVAGEVWKISPTGQISIAAATYTQPAGVAVDSQNNLYFSDPVLGRIARVSPREELVTVVGDGIPGNYWGDGGPATEAALYLPLGVVVDASGNLYIADAGNSRVRKVSPDGVITTVAGTGTAGFSGDGGPAAKAQLTGPAGLALDAAGNLYIADYRDHRIRKISTNGIISTVAGNGSTGQGFGSWGDGGPATSADLAGPMGVAVDANGNLYIADTYHFAVRKVSVGGTITTVAGRSFASFSGGGDGRLATEVGLSAPTGVSVDNAGNFYIATGAGIRKVSSGGIISTVAGNGSTEPAGSSGDGGPATRAALQVPVAIALDMDGSLYISGGQLSGYFDGAGYVRKVTGDGTITTVAGNGARGYSGDGGAATSGSFSASTAGIAVGANGTIYVADVFNNAIRALRVGSSVN